MPYRVVLKLLPDGNWHACCNTAPSSVVEVQAQSREQVIQKVQNEIQYQLEYCPCSGTSAGALQLEVTESEPSR